MFWLGKVREYLMFLDAPGAQAHIISAHINMRVNKWWQNFHFWDNYPFKANIKYKGNS